MSAQEAFKAAPRLAGGRGRPSFLTLTPASSSALLSRTASGGVLSSAGGPSLSSGADSPSSSAAARQDWAVVEGGSTAFRLEGRVAPNQLAERAHITVQSTSASTALHPLPQQQPAALMMGSKLWGRRRFVAQ